MFYDVNKPEVYNFRCTYHLLYTSEKKSEKKSILYKKKHYNLHVWILMKWACYEVSRKKLIAQNRIVSWILLSHWTSKVDKVLFCVNH